MQALSMIDMGGMAPEKLIVNRSSKSDRDFGQVLNEKRQASAAQETAARREQPPARKRSVESSEPAERSQQASETQRQKDRIRQAERQDQTETQTVDEQQKPARAQLPQTLIDLLQRIAAGEQAEGAEDGVSLEEMLGQLLAQLDDADLQGEQVIAGIDLSSLVEQLQALADAPDAEQQLLDLTNALEEQLVAVSEEVSENIDVALDDQQATDEALLANAELAAAMMQTPQQQNDPQLANNLARAREILQRAVDAATGQQEASAEDAAEVMDGLAVSEEPQQTQQAVDPLVQRFANLLQPRRDMEAQPSLRSRMTAETAQVAQDSTAGEDFSELLNMGESTTQTDIAELAKMFGGKLKQNAEHAVSFLQQPPHLQQLSSRMAPQPTAMMQLPSGQQVPESQLLQQVVTHISGSSNGESGRMVLRLQPAELGSLKLELMVEGDRVRANLHAQSQQVQEVLERHLPQLRNALSEQGLKIEQFNVDIDREHNPQSQFEQLAQQHQQRQGAQQQQPDWQPLEGADEQVIPLTHLLQNGGGGISLHV